MAADLMAPSCCNSDNHKAQGIALMRSVCEDLQLGAGRLALCSHMCRQRVSPQNLSDDLAKVNVDPTMAQNQIIPGNLARIELHLQVIISFISLCCKNEAGARNVKTVQEAMIVLGVVPDRAPACGDRMQKKTTTDA